MKKIYFYTLTIVGILILLYFCYINTIEKELTKNSLFDIINNVDEIVISCMVIDGEKILSDENRVDCIIRYIIDNRNLYKDNIIMSDATTYKIEYGTPVYSFGKMTIENFTDVYYDIFSNTNMIFNEEKIDCIELYFEPVEGKYYDSKNIIYIKKKADNYIVDVEYVKKIADRVSRFYMEYEFSYDRKIKQVTIF